MYSQVNKNYWKSRKIKLNEWNYETSEIKRLI